MEQRKANAVLLYVLLHFPDGLKEEELKTILQTAQKVHMDKYDTNFIGKNESEETEECLNMILEVVEKLKNKKTKKQLGEIGKKISFEGQYLVSDLTLYNDYLSEKDTDSLDIAVSEFWQD